MRSAIVLLGSLLGVFSMLGEGSAQPVAKNTVVRGEQLYRDLCSACHGRYGRGDGPAASALKVRPPDFTNAAILAERSNREIVGRLADPETVSHTPMALGAVVKENALTDAITYIRTLSVPGKHVSLPAGRDIYNGSCWVCHGVEGDGKGPATRGMEPQPRDFTSKDFVIEGREAEVYRNISLGAAKAFHGSSYMPAWGTRLSPQQIRDVMEYLKDLKSRANSP